MENVNIEKKTFTTIPVQLPMKRIYMRLGYNFHKTEVADEQRKKIEDSINEGFILCEPKGMYARLDISKKENDKTVLSNGSILTSASLAKLLSHSHAVLIMGATVGKTIVEIIDQKVTTKETSTAVVYDAVGSESADAAVGWINEYVRQQLPRKCEMLTKFRFSPGYGDLDLSNQKIMFQILGLDSIGLELTDKYMLRPEKSVIAIAGIEQTC